MVGASLVDSLDVVAAAVFPLPLASAVLSEPPCLWTNSFVSLPKIAALIRNPWVTEVADSAATTSLSTLVECMASSRFNR